MFTAPQAANDGIDANTLGRLSAENLIYRLRRGVYIHAAVAETPHTDLAAAWLAARPAISAPTVLWSATPWRRRTCLQPTRGAWVM